MRKRIFEIVEVAKDNKDRISFIYDKVMSILIVISVIPLVFKSDYKIFLLTDVITSIAFIIDYILRWITADYKLNNYSIASFLKYPFTFFAIIDLISILPAVSLFNNNFKLFRLFKIIRIFKVFRAFKILRYSRSIVILSHVIENSKNALLAVNSLAMGYIIISALVMFNIEPESFNTLFDAIYWAATGYGDVYTSAGKVIKLISYMLGIAIVTMPSGIITAGYIKTLNDESKKKENNKSKK